jgi:quercetin dioxygenase-like cupin family protein
VTQLAEGILMTAAANASLGTFGRTRKGAAFVADADVAWADSAPGIRRKVLCDDDAVMLVRFAFEAGAVGAEHSHPHKQISVVESGVFDVTIAGVTTRLRAGDSYLVAPNLRHGAVAIEAGVLVDVFSPMREDFV